MQTNEKISNLGEFAKVPVKEKVAYLVGEMGSQSLFYYLILTLSIFFYTDVMHISATVIGSVVIISRIFDSFTDLFAGSLVDRTNTRWGKARPWVIGMTIPYAVALFLIYCVPAHATTAHQIAYVAITYNLAVTICYTLENIPWGTLSTLMSRDQVERSQLSSMRMIGSPLACAIGIGTVLPLINKLGGTQADWMKGMGMFAVIGVIVNLVCAFTIKERVKTESSPEKNKLDIPSTIRNKYWWMNILIIGFYNGYVTCFSTFVPYYATYVLKDTMLTTRLNYMQFGVMALTALASVWICTKMQSTSMVKVGMLIAIIGQSISLLAPENMTVLLISACIRSIGWGFYAALLHSLVGDAVEYGHWRTGHRAPGTTYSAQGVGNKLGVLLGSGVTTLVLGASGYDGAKAVQSASAMAVIRGIYLYLPLVAAVVVLVIMLMWKLNGENYRKIEEDLQNGKYHPNAPYANK